LGLEREKKKNRPQTFWDRKKKNLEKFWGVAKQKGRPEENRCTVPKNTKKVKGKKPHKKGGGKWSPNDPNDKDLKRRPRKNPPFGNKEKKKAENKKGGTGKNQTARFAALGTTASWGVGF